MQVMQLYIVCMKQRTVSLTDVHVFTEYHGSTEHDYGKLAKGGEEESTDKDDTHQIRGHNNINTAVSFTAETDLSGETEEFLTEAQPNRE